MAIRNTAAPEAMPAIALPDNLDELGEGLGVAVPDGVIVELPNIRQSQALQLLGIQTYLLAGAMPTAAFKTSIADSCPQGTFVGICAVQTGE